MPNRLIKKLCIIENNIPDDEALIEVIKRRAIRNALAAGRFTIVFHQEVPAAAPETAQIAPMPQPRLSGKYPQAIETRGTAA